MENQAEESGQNFVGDSVRSHVVLRKAICLSPDF